MGSKRCSACRETKPLSEFYRNARRSDGLQTVCAECQRARERRVPAEQIARELLGLEVEPEDAALLADVPPHRHAPYQIDLRRQIWVCSDLDCGERVDLLQGWPSDPAWEGLEEAVTPRNLPLAQAALALGYEVRTGWLLFARGQPGRPVGSFLTQFEAWDYLRDLRRLRRL